MELWWWYLYSAEGSQPTPPLDTNIAVMISSCLYKSSLISFLLILHIIKQTANIYN